MGLGAMTVLEIFTNPADLEFVIGENQNGKWSIAVSRGPGHNFKPLLTADDYCESKDEALKQVKLLLELICKKGREIVADTDCFLGGMINPKGLHLKKMSVLTEESVSEIMEQLQSTCSSSTYTEDAPRTP